MLEVWWARRYFVKPFEIFRKYAHNLSQIKVNIFQLSQVLHSVSDQHILHQYTTRISSFKIYPSKPFKTNIIVYVITYSVSFLS
jgi:hypothetical protein